MPNTLTPIFYWFNQHNASGSIVLVPYLASYFSYDERFSRTLKQYSIRVDSMTVYLNIQYNSSSNNLTVVLLSSYIRRGNIISSNICFLAHSYYN